MDIYNNAPKYTYVTGSTFFLMPTDSGGIPAIAVTKKTADYITSAYTILMILIFMVGWNLILAIIMAFWPTRGDPNRRSALVALWNSGESMNATTLMVYYCMRVIQYIRGGKPNETSSVPGGKGSQSHLVVTCQSPKNDSNVKGLPDEDAPLIQEKQNRTPDSYFDSNPTRGVSNLLWGLLFVFIASAMTVGNIVAGILVPVQLAMGNVAPANKDAIFYPDVPFYSRDYHRGAGISKLHALKVPSAFRALGVIDSLDVTVRKQVNIDSRTTNGSVRLSYDYNVTGVDMGLLSDPKLRLMVKGSCRTDDTWLLNSTDRGDTYRLFGGNETFEVKHQQGVDVPPMVNWRVNPDTAGASNVSYAMIVSTAGLYSYNSGQDPWYITDKTGANESLQYRVRGGRPALSCWEAKRWHLNGKEVDGSKLNMLPGLKLHKFWADKVFSLEFSVPLVLSVGRAVGSSALKSASFALGPEFILDAGSSALLDDLERLVLASWVSSRNVLRDTTTYRSLNMVNLATGPTGSADVTTGGRPVDFVLQSGDVVTLSVRILIAVPAILLFLFIVKKSLGYTLQSSEFRQDPILPGEKENRTALLATQLYRGLDQRMSSRDWKHTESPSPFAYPTGIEGPIAKNYPYRKARGNSYPETGQCL